MELYVAAIGTKMCMDEWETDLRGVKLPWEHMKNGKKVKEYLRLGVCDFKLKKIFFPKEQLETVMSLVGVSKEESYIIKRYPKIRAGMAILRKALGLKKAPHPKELLMHMQPNAYTKAVAIVPLGIKDDKFDNDGIEVL